MSICGVVALARRCDVRAKYASRLASRAALQLDLFEQPFRALLKDETVTGLQGSRPAGECGRHLPHPRRAVEGCRSPLMI
jgi:hypothetical protein